MVDLPRVDAEHETIVRRLEELREAISVSGDPDEMVATAKELLRFVGLHFSHEERMMRSTDYSAYDWHKRQHDTARRRLAGYVEGGSVPELLDFLGAWLRDHSGLHDRMMGAYLRNFTREHETRPVS
jgi:hemerythrin